MENVLNASLALSTAEPYPASLLSMYSAYKYCVQIGVPSNRIFIVGDSAGGNLALSTTYHILEHSPNQMPAATMMLSAWLDLTQEHTGHSPNQSTDWLTTFDDDSTKTDCIDVYCGPVIKSHGDVRVSPLRRESLQGLPPQFISAGKAEVLYMDSEIWAQRCLKELGEEMVETHFPERQIHTFQIGGWLASREMMAESDRKVLSFIARHLPQN
jgi:acetyl esterase/lipase